MLQRIYFLIIKEFLTCWADKKSRFVLIGPPLIQLVIFSYAMTLEVKDVSVGVLDKDGGAAAHELVERFRGSPTFRRIRYLGSVREIHKAIDAREIQLAIQIPEDFSRLVSGGKTANTQFILDGRQSNSAQIILGYATQIVNQYNTDLATAAGVGLPTAKLVVRNEYNPNLEYKWFTIPSLCASLSMITVPLLTSLSVARERELGTFDQLLVSPLQPLEILIGKTVPALAFGLLSGTEAILSTFFFHVPLTGSLVLLYLSMLVFLLSVVGFGLFISSLCMTQQQAILGTFVFLVPSNLLSGFATPLENVPDWLQPVTWTIPLRYFLIVAKGVFTKDLTAWAVFQETWPMAVIAVFTLTAAGWLFRKRLG